MDSREELLGLVTSFKKQIIAGVETQQGGASNLYMKGTEVSEDVPATPPTPSPAEPPEATITLDDIRAELGDCRRCPLCETRNNLVFGEGDPHADLVFVGEAPGQQEDIKGTPFVGRAGQLLTRIIEAMGLTRNDVYICNILKCRPPGNRNPRPDEIRLCEPFLIRQLRAIEPRVICALGTFAAHTLLDTKTPISLLRGKFHTYQGIKLMPTYHPAYLLRNPNEKKRVWSDVQMIMELLKTER